MAKEGFAERTRRLGRERVARHRARKAKDAREGETTVQVPVRVETVSPGHVLGIAGHHPGCKCLLCQAARS
jgi:CRISPR/Cas system-associated exonuclease Cas4 (RecB family)